MGGLDLELISLIVTKCKSLTELSFSQRTKKAGLSMLSEESLKFLTENLTQTILKLNLENQVYLEDSHIEEPACEKMQQIEGSKFE